MCSHVHHVGKTFPRELHLLPVWAQVHFWAPVVRVPVRLSYKFRFFKSNDFLNAEPTLRGSFHGSETRALSIFDLSGQEWLHSF